MPDIKYMPISEFVEEGYLQEVNRRVLHLAGLALEVREPGPDYEAKVREHVEGSLKGITEPNLVAEAVVEILRSYGVLDARISGVWDYRDDPEGMSFGPNWTGWDHDIVRRKASSVQAEVDKHIAARIEMQGAVVQPLP